MLLKDIVKGNLDKIHNLSAIEIGETLDSLNTERESAINDWHKNKEMLDYADEILIKRNIIKNEIFIRLITLESIELLTETK
jgi:hypothetical protein